MPATFCILIVRSTVVLYVLYQSCELAGSRVELMILLEACLAEQCVEPAEAIANRVQALLRVSGLVREGQLLDLSLDSSLLEVHHYIQEHAVIKL